MDVVRRHANKRVMDTKASEREKGQGINEVLSTLDTNEKVEFNKYTQNKHINE